MRKAFIIRPFGEKANSKKELIDFDAVESQLIGPVLDLLGIRGRTTAEIAEAGNIRVDMFGRILAADLVIADVSIHNANVYYELGMRHALRKGYTILIHGDKGDSTPFDIKTDRYLSYPSANPAQARSELEKMISTTLAGDARDSPVFLTLPKHREPAKIQVHAVPQGFLDDVRQAARQRRQGDLELLRREVQGTWWAVEGVRHIGRRQLELEGYALAKNTWEDIQRVYPDDVEAKLKLGNIHQRLGNIEASEASLKRVLELERASASERNEAEAQLGRNYKTRWAHQWQQQADVRSRQHTALSSPYLRRAAAAYARAFEMDLNNYYPGLNALALRVVERELTAFCQPDVAPEKQQALGHEISQLTGAVEMALRAKRRRVQERAAEDSWLALAEADWYFLTQTDPSGTRARYEAALSEIRATRQDFNEQSAQNQILLYERLGVLADNVRAAIEVFRPVETERRRVRAVMFTGHRIDSPGRATPRFPADQEHVARRAIHKALRKALDDHNQHYPGSELVGIAGGANGGDLLFHEVCAELGIASHLYLVVPPETYSRESVAGASGNGQWLNRFSQLHAKLLAEERVRVLQEYEAAALPRWLQKKEDYSIWQRANLWMLCSARALGKPERLIALWNGKEGDGPGGTRDLVRLAREQGMDPVILNTEQLFGLEPTG